MMNPDRFNPHAMLVMLGSVIYAVVGGPAVIGGGFAIAVALAAWRQHERNAADRSGPTSLFGTPEPTVAHERLASAPPFFQLMPAFAVAPAYRRM
jgi:hypothetical protein